MVCTIEIYEKPKLNDPVLIEGLPGIGFVANIAALHLIHELEAKRFAEIFSAAFQDLAVTTETGGTRSPMNELYYYKRQGNGRDLIIWYGNTQALTTFGQYELCGRVLDLTEELGCHLVISIGGFKQEELKRPPQIYCAASDHETLKEALSLGTKIMVGQIFGIAGLLIGLSRIRGLKGFSLLVETLGTYPDANAARYALSALSKNLNLELDLSRLDVAAEETKKVLESFGLIRNIGEEKKKEEQPFRWFI
ncbi:MAG: PAC2 family protein [Candidatus Bathyarchaeota archaeon]|nr:PAC2 family protein [Candidatus Bathyarchaeota archaeon]MDH5787028.1 PAC2 family protein [Candidatus Bathyarchaeota archaeon]